MRPAPRSSLVLLCAFATTACAPGPVDLGDPASTGRGRPEDKTEVVVVDNLGLGVPGALIGVHSPDGVLEELYRTDRNGRVKVRVPEGGSITRYSNEGPEHLDMETVFAVDASPVRFADPSFFQEPPPPHGPPPPEPTTFEVTVVGAAPEAAFVHAFFPCSFGGFWSTSETGLLSNFGCPADPIESLFVYLRDENFQVLSWGQLDEIPTDPGGTVPLVVDASHVESVARTVTLVDLPPQEPDWTFGQFAAVLTFDYWGAQNGIAPLDFPSQTGTDPIAWTQHLPDATLGGMFADGGATYGLAHLSGGVSSTEPGDVTLSFSGLPLVDAAPVAIAEPGSLALGWTAQGEVEADVAVADIRWTAQDCLHTLHFSGVVPATATEAAMPELPAEFSDWSPDSNGFTFGRVEVWESTWEEDWGDVQADPSRIGNGIVPVIVVDGEVETWAPREGVNRTSGAQSPFVPNDRPVVEITGVSGDVGAGDVSIDYLLSDAEANTARLFIVFSIGDSGEFFDATAAGGDGTSGLATSAEGTPHAFVWDSDADLAGYTGPVVLLLQAADCLGGGSEVILEFD